MTSKTLRVIIAGAAAATLPLIAACGAAGAIPTAAVASMPTPSATVRAAATPTPGPAIGDACLIGTWKLTSGTLVVPLQTQHGQVTVVVTGGAGELEHLFSNGTYVYDEAGAPYEGSAHGYRVVVHPSGVLQATAIFMNGYETLEPIDGSRDRSTVSVNGGAAQRVHDPGYESLTYTCHGSTFTARDAGGDSYAYRRVSTAP